MKRKLQLEQLETRFCPSDLAISVIDVNGNVPSGDWTLQMRNSVYPDEVYEQPKVASGQYTIRNLPEADYFFNITSYPDQVTTLHADGVTHYNVTVLITPPGLPAFGFAVLSGTSLADHLKAADRNFLLDTGTASNLNTTLGYNGYTHTTYGEQVNYVGGGQAVSGTILSTTDLSNGQKLTQIVYVGTYTMTDGQTYDLFTAVV